MDMREAAVGVVAEAMDEEEEEEVAEISMATAIC